MQSNFLKHIGTHLKSYTELKPIKTELTPDIKTFKDIKAIIFDIYGTLIISASGDLDKATITVGNLTKALNQGGFFWSDNNSEKDFGEGLLILFQNTIIEHQQKLKQKGHPYPEVDIIKVWEQCIKVSVKNRWIIKNSNSSIKILTAVFEILSNPVWPMPGMHTVLQTLKAKNTPIGVVSNAQFYTPIIMNYFANGKLTGIEQVIGFDADISVFSYKLSRSKPDTKLFDILAKNLYEKYNFSPHEVLFIGNDMLKDIWAAKQLGFKTALFAGDKRSLRLHENDKRCKGLKPDVIMTELDQLLQIIDN